MRAMKKKEKKMATFKGEEKKEKKVSGKRKKEERKTKSWEEFPRSFHKTRKGIKL